MTLLTDIEDEEKPKRHPKYMHAAERKRLGLTWKKPKWKRKHPRGKVNAKKG